MKSETISSVHDTLCHILQDLFGAEQKFCEAFRKPAFQLSSQDLKIHMTDYMEESVNKVLRLERIFNYLMKEPLRHRNDVVVSMIDCARRLTEHTTTPHLKDIIVINCVENINAYKISAYKTAYLIAAELELDTACDLLQQSLESEMAVRKTLYNLAISEFNRLPV